MSTATSTEATPAPAELLPGYYVEEATGAWLTLPWPSDLAELPPSLGPACIRWAERWLVHHLTGEPWRFTLAQKRFLHLWYAVRPDDRWLMRSGVKRGAKGTGKDPFGGAYGWIEACGPVVLDHWEDGRPVGRPHRMSLVQIGANSEDQAKDLLRVMNGMISQPMADEYRIDAGITQTQMPSGSRIELLTNSERSQEGDPATAVILNETHHMTKTSGGQGLAGVARRNVGKSPDGRARVLELTNAHMPGEGSVAEDSFEAWQAQVAGLTKRQDILYDSREAAPHLRLHVEAELELGIAQAYADSPWTDQERIRDEAQDPRTPAADSVRFYLNALPTNEMAWVEPRRFDALARPGEVVADAEPVAMFLDCSKSGDATTLSACRISDGHVISLGGWQRPHGDRGKGWLAPRHEVDARVRLAMATYAVQWFGVDPSPAKDDETEALYWADTIDGWHRDFRSELPLWATPSAGGNAVLFDMRLSSRGGVERNRLFTEAAMQAAQDIDEWEPESGRPPPLSHDGDPMLRLHVHNARRRPNQWGVSLGKHTRDSKDLVDYAVTMVGARLGRRLVLNSGKLRRRATPSSITVMR